VWDSFAPAMMTLCSPDPQAFRPPEEKVNVLQVTLPTNFKVARFDLEKATAMLRQLEADIEAVRFDTGDAKIELPVKLKVHDSIFVPLANGNAAHRQLSAASRRTPLAPSRKPSTPISRPRARSIIGWSNSASNWAQSRDDLVPYRKNIAAAAQVLVRPSSAARALFAGAPNIERVDRLVQSIAAQQGMHNPVVVRDRRHGGRTSRDEQESGRLIIRAAQL